jgi:hypothetical protein
VSIIFFIQPVVLLPIISPFVLQSDEDCCNSCEDVREAYRKKGWAVTNPDLMDQVLYCVIIYWSSRFNFQEQTE